MDNTQEKGYGYGKRPLWQWILIYVVIGGIIYALVYYFVIAKRGGYQTGQYQYPTTAYTQPTTQTNPTENTSAANPTSNTAAVKISVDGSEFAFTPSKISLKMGTPVELTFKNMGKYPHNLTASGLNVQTKTINPGETDTITFTPDKAGTYDFMCTVPGHADKGMKGTITVQ